MSVFTALVHAIKTQPISVCLGCALPHTSTLQRNSPEIPKAQQCDKHLYAWLEVCRIAQGAHQEINMIKPQKWAEMTHNPIESMRYRHLQGQKVTLRPPHEHGQSRTGRILLVTEPLSHKTPRALIHLDPKPPQTAHCFLCKQNTPTQIEGNRKQLSRPCSECNLPFHKKCVLEKMREKETQRKNFNFPSQDWYYAPTRGKPRKD